LSFTILREHINLWQEKRLQRVIGEEKLPGRQHELYNEKQTKVHLKS